MKKVQRLLAACAFTACILTTGCKPNGDKNSTDTQNEFKGSGNDSSRYPGMSDSTVANKDSANMYNK